MSKETCPKCENIKAILIDIISTNDPDVVNAIHPLICEIMDANEITNPHVLAACEAADRGEVTEFDLPHPDNFNNVNGEEI